MKAIKILFISILLCKVTISQQSIRINEFSQGSSGSKEWVELFVTSTSPVGIGNCSSVRLNIAGWILDDNNGDFSPINHFTGTGIAGGHLRFKNASPWTSLPVGVLIVIYNSADKEATFPADDPLDLNGDCVYVVPSNHSSLEYCTTLPLVSNCTSRSNYGVCTYTNATATSWTAIGLANAGDAIQIRDPSFNLVHGLVYGKSTSASGCTTTPDMVGTALAPLISNLAMSGTSAAFSGTSDGDFFSAGGWTIQNASLSTPGRLNNANDSIYIRNSVRGGCTCLQVLPLEDDIRVYYQRKMETRVEIVGTVLRSTFTGKRYNQQILIYDVAGRLLSSMTTFVKERGEVDLLSKLTPGLNIIKVNVDNRRQDQFIFKIVK